MIMRCSLQILSESQTAHNWSRARNIATNILLFQLHVNKLSIKAQKTLPILYPSANAKFQSASLAHTYT